MSKTKGKGREAKEMVLVDEKMPRCTSNQMPALCLKLGPLGRAFVVTNALYLASWKKQQAHQAAGTFIRTDFQPPPSNLG